MKPTEHFLQHHDVEPPLIDASSFRPAWRVRTRLERLLLYRLITPAEWFAAVTLRLAVERIASAGLHAIPTVFMPGHNKTPQDCSQADAYCRRAAEILGETIYPMLLACVVEDLSWIALGERMHVDARTARAWVVVAIKLLAKV
jgi:hypothetical protein